MHTDPDFPWFFDSTNSSNLRFDKNLNKNTLQNELAKKTIWRKATT